MKPILACTDGSLYAPSIYQHSAWLAERMGSSIQVLHALEREEPNLGRDLTGNLGFNAGADLLEEIVSLEEAHSRVALLRGKAVLDDAVKELTKSGAVVAEAFQRHGSLVDTVEEFDDASEMIVLGKRGEHADFAKAHLGSNLERVVRASQVPVFVASREFRPIESVLIAFDGGESSLKAIHYLASVPLLKGLKCQLVSVGNEGGNLELDLKIAVHALEGAGFEVSSKYLQGDPESSIAHEVAEGSFDLLVMGAYGHSKIRRLLIGSITTALIRDCQIPVLLFR